MCRLFTGYYNNPVRLSGGLIWIQYLSFLNYSFAAIARNEIEPLKFFCKPEQLIGGVCPITSGTQALEHFGLIEMEIWQCELVLIGFIFFFRIVGYLFVLKNKQGT